MVWDGESSVYVTRKPISILSIMHVVVGTTDRTYVSLSALTFHRGVINTPSGVVVTRYTYHHHPVAFVETGDCVRVVGRVLYV